MQEMTESILKNVEKLVSKIFYRVNYIIHDAFINQNNQQIAIKTIFYEFLRKVVDRGSFSLMLLLDHEKKS